MTFLWGHKHFEPKAVSNMIEISCTQEIVCTEMLDICRFESFIILYDPQPTKQCKYYCNVLNIF